VTLRGNAGHGGQRWRVPERRGGGEAEEGLGTAATMGVGSYSTGVEGGREN
jgi:hypothetical protein